MSVYVWDKGGGGGGWSEAETREGQLSYFLEINCLSDIGLSELFHGSQLAHGD